MSHEHAAVEVGNLNELRWILLRHRVLFFLWIFGRKNASHLLDEIRQGETQLIQDSEHGLVRQTHVLNIEVRYVDTLGQEWILREDRQEWHHKKDSHGQKRVDRRNHRFVSEKVERDEIYADGSIHEEKAITRALFEELDGVRLYERKTSDGESVVVKNSSSYPGLRTKFLVHNFCVYLPQREWRPEYVEKGKEKSTYFVWDRVE